MILPPLVHAPFHHAHRAEMRVIPYIRDGTLHITPRFLFKVVAALLLTIVFLTLALRS